MDFPEAPAAAIIAAAVVDHGVCNGARRGESEITDGDLVRQARLENAALPSLQVSASLNVHVLMHDKKILGQSIGGATDR